MHKQQSLFILVNLNAKHNENNTYHKMNWMTSAKKRMSKARKHKPDEHKRWNAFKKLNKTQRVNVLKINHQPEGAEGNKSHDWRMVANLSEENYVQNIQNQNIDFNNQDPFATLEISSEDDEMVINQETFPAQNQASTNKSIPARQCNEEFQINSPPMVKKAHNDPKEIISESRSVPSQKRTRSVETKETDASQIAQIWGLFESDSRGWRYPSPSHFEYSEKDQGSTRSNAPSKTFQHEHNTKDVAYSVSYQTPITNEEVELEVSDFI